MTTIQSQVMDVAQIVLEKPTTTAIQLSLTERPHVSLLAETVSINQFLEKVVMTEIM